MSTTLAACGGGDIGSSPNGVTLYRYAGSVQCTGGGLTLADMNMQLTNAGVLVYSASCGSDGYIHAGGCGSPDGRIGIFEVPTSQAQAASALGFAPLSGLPYAFKTSCP